MLALALALTLAAAPSPLPPPATTLVVRIPDRALCHDIDPNFVLYVEPARHAPGANPLLWWIGGAPDNTLSPAPPIFDDRPAIKPTPKAKGLDQRFLDFRPAIKDPNGPAPLPPPGCARTIPAR
jgi:hypothetical protein